MRGFGALDNSRDRSPSRTIVALQVGLSGGKSLFLFSLGGILANPDPDLIAKINNKGILRVKIFLG